MIRYLVILFNVLVDVLHIFSCIMCWDDTYEWSFNFLGHYAIRRDIGGKEKRNIEGFFQIISTLGAWWRLGNPFSEIFFFSKYFLHQVLF